MDMPPRIALLVSVKIRVDSPVFIQIQRRRIENKRNLRYCKKGNKRYIRQFSVEIEIKLRMYSKKKC
jgi:hypothetical protein